MIFDEQIFLTWRWLYKSNQIPDEFFTPFLTLYIQYILGYSKLKPKFKVVDHIRIYK